MDAQTPSSLCLPRLSAPAALVTRVLLCAVMLALTLFHVAPAGATCLQDATCLEKEPAPASAHTAHDEQFFRYRCSGVNYATGCSGWASDEASIVSQVFAAVLADMTVRPTLFLCPGARSPLSMRIENNEGWASLEKPRTYYGYSQRRTHPLYHKADLFLIETSKAFNFVYNCPTDSINRYKTYELYKQRVAVCPEGTTGRSCERPEYLHAPGKNIGNCCPNNPATNAPREGDPIYPATGNVYYREVDYRGAGAFALRFVRHYNSYGRARPARIGRNWRHTYAREVFRRGFTATVYRPDGASWHFRRLPDGSWAADADVRTRLLAVADAHGQVSGWEVRLSDDSRERYDAQGRFTSVTNAAGLTQRAHYDAHGRLAEVSDPFGRTLRFEYDGERMAGVIDPAGQRIEYRYDDTRLQQVVYVHDAPQPTQRRYHYDDDRHPFHLSGVSDERGVRAVTWAYDERARAIYNARAGGVDAVWLSYDDASSATATDAANRRTHYRFIFRQGSVRLSSMTGEPCVGCAVSAAAISYDANGYIASKTDHDGVITRYRYDARGLQQSRTEALGRAEQRTVSTEWHALWRKPVRISEAGRMTDFRYDDAGRLLSHTETDVATGRSRTVTRSYDAHGLLASIDGPREDVDDVTHFAYLDGDLHTVTNALGHQTRIEAVDVHGRIVRLRDANALITEFDYDARGRLIEQRVGARVTRYAFDAAGNLTTVMLPDLSTLYYEYDDANRLTALADALGQRIEYTLDAVGNRTREQVFDAHGTLTRTRAQAYDTLRRVIERSAGAGQRERFEYDALGRVLAAIDAKQQRSTRGYDALGRLSQHTDALLGETHFEYDARDNLLAVSAAHGLTTHYGYNGFDERVQQSSPDTGVSTYTHDEAGNRTSRTDARDVRVLTRYDALNRITAREYPDAAGNTHWHYDSAPNGVGRLARIDDASGQTEFAYDLYGNVVRYTRTIDGRRYELGYAYDAMNRVLRIDYPSGASVHYERDGLGRVTRVALTRDGVREVLASDIDYEPFGAANALLLGNALPASWRFDLAGRVTGVNTPGILERDYLYDANDNILDIDDGLSPTAGQGFEYDALNRLVAADGEYGALEYGYDAIGNRTRLSSPAGEDTYHYDPLSARLLNISGANAQRFAYDTAGNTVERGVRDYRYNDAGRLSAVTIGGVEQASYTYNALGERSTRQSAQGVEHFVYGLDGERLVDSDASGALSAEYVYRDGVLLARLLTAAGTPTTARAAITPPGGYRMTFDDKRNNGQGETVLVPDVQVDIELSPPRLTLREHGQVVHTEALRMRGRITARTRFIILFGASARNRTRLFLWPRDNPQRLRAWLRISAPLAHGGRLTRTLTRHELVSIEAMPAPASNEHSVQYYHLDHLGTPQALTDETGTVLWRADYRPFGEVLETVNDTEQPLRFPGQSVDEQAGGYYNYFRYYDPGTGRYLTSDPIGLGGGINTYGYALANPLRFSDPTGEFVFVIPALPAILGSGSIVGVGKALLGGTALAALLSISSDATTEDNCSDEPIHRGRVQAQGAGYEDSEAWSRSTPLTLEEGLEKLDALVARMPRRTKRARNVAIENARRWMIGRSQGGGVPAFESRTFQNPGSRRGERIDIEVIQGKAFVP